MTHPRQRAAGRAAGDSAVAAGARVAVPASKPEWPMLVPDLVVGARARASADSNR